MHFSNASTVGNLDTLSGIAGPQRQINVDHVLDEMGDSVQELRSQGTKQGHSSTTVTAGYSEVPVCSLKTIISRGV